MQILIGNAYYNCSCLSYVTSNLWLVVGVSTAAGFLAIIVIIVIITIIVVMCRRRRNKPKQERPATVNNCDNRAESIELDEDDRYYSTIGLPAAEANNSANAYCRPLPAEPEQNSTDYSALGSAEPEPTNNNNDTPYYLSLTGEDAC